MMAFILAGTCLTFISVGIVLAIVEGVSRLIVKFKP